MFPILSSSFYKKNYIFLTVYYNTYFLYTHIFFYYNLKKFIKINHHSFLLLSNTYLLYFFINVKTHQGFLKKARYRYKDVLKSKKIFLNKLRKRKKR